MASELKAGVCLNYVSIAIRLGTSFFLTPFIIERLGVNEYGLFMLSGTVIAWLSLTDFGLGATVSKYAATYHAKGEAERESHFLGQAMMLFSALGLLTFLIGIACYFSLSSFFPDLNYEEMGTLRILYLLTLGNLVLAFPLRPIGCVPGAHMKFIVPGVVHLVLSLLNAGLTVLLLCLGYKAIGLTVLVVGVSVAGLAWGLYYVVCRMGVRLLFRKPDTALYREMFGFSFWMMLNQLMDLFYWRAGTPILARFSGMGAVALFTIGVSFAQYFMTASCAISGVVAPKLMHMVALGADKAELTRAMIRTGRLQLYLLAVILLGFTCLGEDFLRLWVGESIGEGVRTVWLGAMLTIIPLLIPLTQNTGIAILQALNIHKGRAVILFYSSLICVILGVLVSSTHGAIGMFIATAASLFIGQGLLLNIYYARKAGLHMGRFFRETWLPMLPSIAVLVPAGFALKTLYPPSDWGELLTLGAIYSCLSLALLWLFYLRGEERAALAQPFAGASKKCGPRC